MKRLIKLLSIKVLNSYVKSHGSSKIYRFLGNILANSCFFYVLNIEEYKHMYINQFSVKI